MGNLPTSQTPRGFYWKCKDFKVSSSNMHVTSAKGESLPSLRNHLLENPGETSETMPHYDDQHLDAGRCLCKCVYSTNSMHEKRCTVRLLVHTPLREQSAKEGTCKRESEAGWPIFSCGAAYPGYHRDSSCFFCSPQRLVPLVALSLTRRASHANTVQ